MKSIREIPRSTTKLSSVCPAPRYAGQPRAMGIYDHPGLVVSRLIGKGQLHRSVAVGERHGEGENVLTKPFRAMWLITR